jgi:hypothetical protein
MRNMPDHFAILEENKKLRRLQLMIDLTIQILYQSDTLDFKGAMNYVQNARSFALALFPDKGSTFDLIYRPRLMRVIREKGILDFSKN